MLNAMQNVRKLSSAANKIRVNGVNLQCYQSGRGPHKIMLLPGALGSGQTDFASQLEGLNHEKYKMITFDPRGYAGSRPPQRDFPADYLRRDAKDAAAIMAALRHDRYSLIGWSDGAMSALIQAATYPERVHKLLVFGANAYITETDIQGYEKTRDISAWSKRMREPMIAMYGEEHFQSMWSGWIDGMKAIRKVNDGNVCREDCHQITCTTLIVHGEKDVMVDHEHPEYIHKTISGSRLLMMPEGKHNLHMRYAKEFNEHAEAFLDGD